MEATYDTWSDEIDFSRVESRIFSPGDSSSSYKASSSIDIDQKDVSSSIKDAGRPKRDQRSAEMAAAVQRSSRQHGKPQLASSVRDQQEEFSINAHQIGEARNSANVSKGMAESGHVSSLDDESGSRFAFRRNRSKRRKAEKLAARNTKAKRLRGVYNDDYRVLLNEDIRYAVSFPATKEYESLPQSQLGITIWTSAEKDKFFTALARLGKDDVREIASRIGSKSEIEVQEYIQLLHHGILEKALNEPRQQLLGLTEIPAAVQVSEDCCEMLENAADALAFRQERHEEHAEQKKWGEFWVLTSNVNNWVEEQLREEGSSQIVRETLPAAELLNLRNWLELSYRIFMNPAAPRDNENWHNLASIDEEPAIRATAFSDFQNLTISITKRLISATIFCTMSRLRAMDSKSFKPDEIVKVVDVEAATKMLGLETNSEKFWCGCPRRCTLRVYKTLSLAAAGREAMSYSEVEKALTREEGSTVTSPLHIDDEPDSPDSPDESLDEETSSPSHSGRTSDSNLHSILSQERSLNELINRDLASEYMREIMSEFRRPIDPSDSEFDDPYKRHERVSQKAKLKAELDRAHDEYAEAFDLQASLVEERKLWNMLKQAPPFTVRPGNVQLPEQPKQDRKEGDEVEDWRNHLDFRSEWETLEKPLNPTVFSKMSQKYLATLASTIEDEESEADSEASHKELADHMLHDSDSEIQDTAAHGMEMLSTDLDNSSV